MGSDQGKRPPRASSGTRARSTAVARSAWAAGTSSSRRRSARSGRRASNTSSMPGCSATRCSRSMRYAAGSRRLGSGPCPGVVQATAVGDGEPGPPHVAVVGGLAEDQLAEVEVAVVVVRERPHVVFPGAAVSAETKRTGDLHRAPRPGEVGVVVLVDWGESPAPVPSGTPAPSSDVVPQARASTHSTHRVMTAPGQRFTVPVFVGQPSPTAADATPLVRVGTVATLPSVDLERCEPRCDPSAGRGAGGLQPGQRVGRGDNGRGRSRTPHRPLDLHPGWPARRAQHGAARSPKAPRPARPDGSRHRGEPRRPASARGPPSAAPGSTAPASGRCCPRRCARRHLRRLRTRAHRAVGPSPASWYRPPAAVHHMAMHHGRGMLQGHGEAVDQLEPLGHAIGVFDTPGDELLTRGDRDGQPAGGLGQAHGLPQPGLVGVPALGVQLEVHPQRGDVHLRGGDARSLVQLPTALQRSLVERAGPRELCRAWDTPPRSASTRAGPSQPFEGGSGLVQTPPQVGHASRGVDARHVEHLVAHGPQHAVAQPIGGEQRPVAKGLQTLQGVGTHRRRGILQSERPLEARTAGQHMPGLWVACVPRHVQRSAQAAVFAPGCRVGRPPVPASAPPTSPGAGCGRGRPPGSAPEARRPPGPPSRSAPGRMDRAPDHWRGPPGRTAA